MINFLLSHYCETNVEEANRVKSKEGSAREGNVEQMNMVEETCVQR